MPQSGQVLSFGVMAVALFGNDLLDQPAHHRQDVEPPEHHRRGDHHRPARRRAVATKRQQEIIAALDITKNQATAKVDEGTEQSAEFDDAATQQSTRNKRGRAAVVGV